MKQTSKIVLATFLGLVNGYLLGEVREQWNGASDVGRQWIRIIVPCMMVISSLVIVAIVVAADWVWRKSTRNSTGTR